MNKYLLVYTTAVPINKYVYKNHEIFVSFNLISFKNYYSSKILAF